MTDDIDSLQQRFVSLMRQYHPLVRTLCWRYSGGDAARCAELVQDCYFAIWRHVHELRVDADKRQTRSWIAWRCRSALQHHFRRRRHRWLSLDAMTYDRQDGSDDLRAKVEELAEGLTEREQRYLTLLLNGYTHAEIAQHLEIEVDSVYKMRRRVINKMKNNANISPKDGRDKPGTDA